MGTTMRYSAAFQAKMVQRMAAPGGPSANALAQEVGVDQSTLSRWRRRAARVDGMSKKTGKTSRRPQDWMAAEKLEAVLKAAELPDEQLGSFLRREGLHRTHLEQWRQQMLLGLEERPQRRRSALSAEGRRIRDLEKELRRKDAALAETAALLVLKKKAQAIWGDGDDSTPSKRGR
jgi:transposase